MEWLLQYGHVYNQCLAYNREARRGHVFTDYIDEFKQCCWTAAAGALLWGTVDSTPTEGTSDVMLRVVIEELVEAGFHVLTVYNINNVTKVIQCYGNRYDTKITEYLNMETVLQLIDRIGRRDIEAYNTLTHSNVTEITASDRPVLKIETYAACPFYTTRIRHELETATGVEGVEEALAALPL